MWESGRSYTVGMRLPPGQLAREIRAGKFAQAYYFFGEDDSRIVEAIRFVGQAFLPEALRMTNITRIDLNSQKFSDLQLALIEPPFFGERTLLIVLDIQKLQPKQLESALALLKPEVEGRLVVFQTRAARKPRKSSAALRKLEIATTVVEFPHLNKSEAISLARQQFKKSETKIDDGALGVLAEMTGGDFGRLRSEIEKLANYSGVDQTVDREVVRHVCSESAKQTVFEIVDQIVKGDISAALSSLRPLLDSGESPGGILFWLGNHYLNLCLVQGGRRPQQAPPWVLNKLAGQCRLISAARLREGIALISQCEARTRGGVVNGRRIDSSTISLREALIDLTVVLCSGVETRSAGVAGSGR